MIRSILLLAAFAASSISVAQYQPVDVGSSVRFSIKNFGINTGGSFAGLHGKVNFDGNHPDAASFDVSIDAATIHTSIDLRDEHLRGETYFDVKKYPQIHFVSTRITPSATTGEMIISGKLTIKDRTKDISFPFTAVPMQDGFLFKGNFQINRKDFGVGGSGPISNSLEVQLTVLTKK
ncbi:MAG: YceI family protein [Bacteroidota bacterium]